MKKEEIEKMAMEISREIKARNEKNRLELMMMYGSKWSEEHRRQQIDKEQADYERSFMPKRSPSRINSEEN